MDAFLLVAIVLVLGLAVAPMFLMRGQYGKAKPKPGKRSDGSGDGSTGVVIAAGGTGGKSKGHDSDSGSDGGSDGGGGGGD